MRSTVPLPTVNGAFGLVIDKIGGGNLDYEYVAERVAVSAVLGGTATELGGGKFANGAITAAFLRLYNEEHQLAAARGSSRPLTGGEIKMLQAVYGDSIDYDEVRVYHKTFWWLQVRSQFITPNGNIYAPNRLYRDDYSLDPDLGLCAVFVHDLTHVWQWQNGVTVWLVGMFDRKYTYAFTPGKTFASYGLEQQASIVEDYARLNYGIGLRSAVNNPTVGQLNSILPFGH